MRIMRLERVEPKCRLKSELKRHALVHEANTLGPAQLSVVESVGATLVENGRDIVRRQLVVGSILQPFQWENKRVVGLKVIGQTLYLVAQRVSGVIRYNDCQSTEMLLDGLSINGVNSVGATFHDDAFGNFIGGLKQELAIRHSQVGIDDCQAINEQEVTHCKQYKAGQAGEDKSCFMHLGSQHQKLK